MGIDEPLWWLFCGTECSGHFIGPFLDQHEADDSVRLTSCKHDHAQFRMSMTQMVAKLPPTVRLWTGGIRDARTTPTRLLIQRPRRPLIAWERWPAYGSALTVMKEWTCA